MKNTLLFCLVFVLLVIPAFSQVPYAVAVGSNNNTPPNGVVVTVNDLSSMTELFSYNIANSESVGWEWTQHIALFPDLSGCYVSYVDSQRLTAIAEFSLSGTQSSFIRSFTLPPPYQFGASDMDITPDGRYLILNIPLEMDVIVYDLQTSTFAEVTTPYSAYSGNVPKYGKVKAISDTLALTYIGGKSNNPVLNQFYPYLALEFNPITATTINTWSVYPPGAPSQQAPVDLEYHPSGLAASDVLYGPVLGGPWDWNFGVGLWLPGTGYFTSYLPTITAIYPAIPAFTTFSNVVIDPNLQFIWVAAQTTTDFPLGGEAMYLPGSNTWALGGYTQNGIYSNDAIYHPTGMYVSFNDYSVTPGLQQSLNFRNWFGGVTVYPGVVLEEKMQYMTSAQNNIVGYGRPGGATLNKVIGKFNRITTAYSTLSPSIPSFLNDLVVY